jgi:hypothetical protein
MHDLLFELCTWHALAKLRMHTETTIRDLEHSTRRLGFIVRDFKRTICAEYQTKELPADNAPRGRRKAARTSKMPSRQNKKALKKSEAEKKKKFNLTTYKWHALADYPAAIRRFGPVDGYTTEVVRNLCAAATTMILYSFVPGRNTAQNGETVLFTSVKSATHKKCRKTAAPRTDTEEAYHSVQIITAGQHIK